MNEPFDFEKMVRVLYAATHPSSKQARKFAKGEMEILTQIFVKDLAAKSEASSRADLMRTFVDFICNSAEEQEMNLQLFHDFLKAHDVGQHQMLFYVEDKLQ